MPPVSNTWQSLVTDPFRSGVSRQVKLRSYWRSGRTDSSCCYEWHQRSQFMEDNTEPSFLPTITGHRCRILFIIRGQSRSTFWGGMALSVKRLATSQAHLDAFHENVSPAARRLGLKCNKSNFHSGSAPDHTGLSSPNPLVRLGVRWRTLFPLDTMSQYQAITLSKCSDAYVTSNFYWQQSYTGEGAERWGHHRNVVT